MSSRWGRAALSHRIFTGIRRRTLGKLIAELAGPWTAAGEARLRERRDHERLRAAGAGPDHDLPFTDRVIVTLVYLRFQLPHAALAELYRVDRSTISRAVGEIRPLLAARGFAVMRMLREHDMKAGLASGLRTRLRSSVQATPETHSYFAARRSYRSPKATTSTRPPNAHSRCSAISD